MNRDRARRRDRSADGRASDHAMSVLATIAIEAETVGDPLTMFRLRIDNKVVGENLTAVQTHLLVGEILERIVLPKKARKLACTLEASDIE
jgi:hypothetical protein